MESKFWQTSPFAEESIFHESFDEKQLNQELLLQNNAFLTANKNRPSLLVKGTNEINGKFLEYLLEPGYYILDKEKAIVADLLKFELINTKNDILTAFTTSFIIDFKTTVKNAKKPTTSLIIIDMLCDLFCMFLLPNIVTFVATKFISQSLKTSYSSFVARYLLYNNRSKAEKILEKTISNVKSNVLKNKSALKNDVISSAIANNSDDTDVFIKLTMLNVADSIDILGINCTTESNSFTFFDQVFLLAYLQSKGLKDFQEHSDTVMKDFNTFVKPIGNEHTLGKILYYNKLYLGLIETDGNEIIPSMIVSVKGFIPYELGQFALYKFECSFDKEIETFQNYTLRSCVNFSKGSKMEGLYEMLK